jgi:hypothetical protein
MARARKASPRVKAARAKAAPRKGARKTKARKKPAGRTKTRNPPSADPLDNFVEAAARALGLPIEPQWRAAIKANLAVNLRLAGFVAEFPLPDEAQPAPIFTA